MAENIVEKLLAGASLCSVMQPDDAIPTNRPLHDECFQLPHVIVNGEDFTGITGREIVTKPVENWPCVFYYTNYRELFGTFGPGMVEPAAGMGHDAMSVYFSPRKRYRKFEWLLKENVTKVWDSEAGEDFTAIRAAVLRAVPLKAVFLDEELVWNIHPIILPQVECHADAFLMQTAYIVYTQLFRQPKAFAAHIDGDADLRHYATDERLCFAQTRVVTTSPFHAFYHLRHDGTYKSYYDLSRGDTMRTYRRLMIFAEA